MFSGKLSRKALFVFFATLSSVIFLLAFFLAFQLISTKKQEATSTSSSTSAKNKLTTNSSEMKIEEAVTPQKLPPQSATGTILTMFMTFYGWADNTPPGNAIMYHKSAYPKSLHEVASGVGTYADPITTAVNKDFPWAAGTRLYVPYLKKYLIIEDFCNDCASDQIDVWMNSNEAFEDQLIACEEKWTRETSVEVNPPPTRTVDQTNLFDTSTGGCL